MAKKRVPGHEITKHQKILRNLCFGCGKDNPHGMHLKFFYRGRTEDEIPKLSKSARSRLPSINRAGSPLGKQRRHVLPVLYVSSFLVLKPTPTASAVGAEESRLNPDHKFPMRHL